MSDSPENPNDPASVTQSTQAIRDTTKWIFATGAGLVAVLVAGINFSELSASRLSSSQFAVALLAVAAGFGTLVIVLQRASILLTRTHPTLRDVLGLVELGHYDNGTKALRAALIAEHDYLFATDARNVNHLWHQIRERNRRAREGQPVHDDPRLARAETRVVDFADFILTRERFKGLLRAIVVAVPLLIAAGIVVGSVTRTDSDEFTPLLAEVRVAVLETPLMQHVREYAKCDSPPFDKAVLVGTYKNSEDVQISLPTQGACRATSFRAAVGDLYIARRV